MREGVNITFSVDIGLLEFDTLGFQIQTYVLRKTYVDYGKLLIDRLSSLHPEQKKMLWKHISKLAVLSLESRVPMHQEMLFNKIPEKRSSSKTASGEK